MPVEAAPLDYRPALRVIERGRVSSVGDGIVWIEGLPSARMDGIVKIDDGSEALVFHLTPERLGAILLISTPALMAGCEARLSDEALTMPATDALLGRVVDPLACPLDDGGPVEGNGHRPVDGPSPPIVARDFVDRPLYTGSKVVDTLIPIGRGQRQLLIGDNGTGKSALALDAVIAQRDQGVRCVYVLIGQKRSSVVQTIDTLRAHDALAFTTLVVAEATASPGIKYLAPFAGCAIAEGWMAAGHDTLVVYDDLTTHARAYRELSLLLRRPPGREAYPADIFYLHARLLERSTRLAAEHGGGSMTALPIAETEQGEIAAYIPTNLISITDGQIHFDAALFARGVLPAIDITRSVSRIGGKAQHEAIGREAGRMKLDYLQFLELEVFTRFGAKLDAGMSARIARGRLLRAILAQDRLDPHTPRDQLAWMIACNENRLDGLDGDALHTTLTQLRDAVAASELTLDSPRQDWLDAVRRTLGHAP
ncbi:F0F1 ATP synthase subunit alpha [Nitrogeniibacter mangrovi]|uniref:F0F1 ATP synthase subunit alpha n=1 Tax=Nitrogeniibacter mangrovi TaxID=2016596 RepID=A0A6C1B5U5_9RHOO|nr:F0F1 ATP synthase subunit alpha [Nitrogeniibacter mangrovi]QID18837.1 F0F1 ATP synthase subunit alpha [Nitrogeniibacter mangrovi]